MSIKGELPLAVHPKYRTRRTRKWSTILAVVIGTFQLWMLWTRWINSSLWLPNLLETASETHSVCPQVPEYDPKNALGGRKIELPTIREAVDRLSQAVQLDTATHDDWVDPNDDPEPWRKFNAFANFLEKTFLAVHAHESPLKREFVHQHGLLYIWPGSDASLKPLVLTAHQDVVPIDPTTLHDWIFPPFSGYIDLENQTVWGRGSYDCKVRVLGILSAAESLLRSDWSPRRTIIFAYGFDEEIGGKQGAQYIGKRLEELYGVNGIAMLVDEGMPVYSAHDVESFGAPIAAPAVSEKGALNVRIEVRSKGGHSSMPPAHTSISLLSKLVTILEDHPFPDKIVEKSKAQIRFLQCLRDHPHVSDRMRHALMELEYAERSLDTEFLRLYAAELPVYERLYLRLAPASVVQSRLGRARKRVLDLLSVNTRLVLKTTQAVDVIEGGVKVNALPESAHAIINHRIAPYSSVEETKVRYKKLLAPVAEELGLSLTAFDEKLIPHTNASVGSLALSSESWEREVAHISAFEGENAGPFRLLSSVIRQTWHLDDPRHILHEGAETVTTPKKASMEALRVTPSIMFANTDTLWYKNLTLNVFRFAPATLHRDLTGIPTLHTTHTVNEHIPIDSIVKANEFYVNLVVAADFEDLEKV